MNEIMFRLAAPLVLPNRVSLGRSWQAAAGAKAAARTSLAWEVRAATGTVPAPIAYAVIKVWRHGIQEPDQDNLYASLKGLLDVLQPASKRHPYGLGIILNDNSAHLSAQVFHVKAAHRSDQCTRVMIREVTADSLAAMRLENA